MKLIFRPLCLEFEMKENIVTTLQIENVNIMRDFVAYLTAETNGSDGEIILADKEKVFKFDKIAEVIFNPFYAECNNKKIMNHLYQEISNISKVKLCELVQNVNQTVVNYLDIVSNEVAYPIDYNPSPDIIGLLKAFEVTIQQELDSVPERIIQYVKLMHQICGVEIFIFYHLKDYLDEKEMEMFLQSIEYEKVNLVLLESSEKYLTEFEKRVIIDKDCCII